MKQDFHQSLLELREDLAQAGLLYLQEHGPNIQAELGGVPAELAGVVGAAHQGVDGWFWGLSPQTAQRLRIPKRNEEGVLLGTLHAWAGLRTVNESMLIVCDKWPHVRNAYEGHAYWAAVLQVHALGAPAFAALTKYVGGPEYLIDLVRRGDAPNVGELDSGTISRRILIADLRVQAAEQLHGGDIPPRDGHLVPAPDERLRRKVARYASAAGVVAHAANFAVANGWLPVPRWFAMPPVGGA